MKIHATSDSTCSKFTLIRLHNIKKQWKNSAKFLSQLPKTQGVYLSRCEQQLNQAEPLVIEFEQTIPRTEISADTINILPRALLIVHPFKHSLAHTRRQYSPRSKSLKQQNCCSRSTACASAKINSAIGLARERIANAKIIAIARAHESSN